MKSFTIYRDSWRRGGGDDNEFGDTNLFNPLNMQCCLGQVAREAGIPLKNMHNVGEPGDIEDMDEPDYSALVEAGLLYEVDGGDHRQTKLANEAIATNDNESICDAERESLLTKLFGSIGVTLTFVDGEAPWFTTEAA